MEEKRGRPTGNVIFARSTLESSLIIARTIWDKNSGNAMTLNDLSKQSSMSVQGKNFRNMTRASMIYGLTDGSHNQDTQRKISLTTLGTSIIAPKSGEDVKRLKINAILSIRLYKKLIDSMNGKKITSKDMLENELIRMYGVRKDSVKICCKIFLDNLSDLNLIEKRLDGDYLVLHDIQDKAQKSNNKQINNDNTNESENNSEIKQPSTKKIFIGHGHNTNAVKQLEGILTMFNIPFKNATTESNKGRPISEKVKETMHECSSGIFLLTKEEETKDKDGNIIHLPNSNVINELTIATYAYNNKFIILKEEGVKMPTNMQDLAYISFNSDELTVKGIDILKELIGLKIISINVL